jgi:universal stress protein E
MKPIQRILVIVDKPKHDQLALERGFELKRALGAKLHLISFAYHAMYNHKSVFPKEERQAVRKQLVDERMEWLASQVERFGRDEDVTFETLWANDLAAEVNELVRAQKFELVVKSAHRSRTLTHTPTDWDLLRGCPAPVLLTVQAWPRQLKVLAALDLNSEDKPHRRLNLKVMWAANEIAKRSGGEVHCVYAIELPRYRTLLDAERAEKKARDLAAGLLGELVSPYDVPGSRVHLEAGKVGAVVNGVAARIGANVLVLGTTARKGLSGLVIGNSAERVLAKAQCDVLALKP